MKKALPYLFHIACSLSLIIFIIVLLKFLLKIELKTWHFAILGGLITVIIPEFNTVETPSGSKLQIKWLSMFHKKK